MSVENRSLLGGLLFVGAAQLILVTTVAEALYPGYSVATNYISDLGVGSTALLFNASVVVYGVAAFIGAVSGRRTLGPLLMLTLALSGACSVGVGLFPETVFIPHASFAFIGFLSGAATAIISSRIVHRPLSYFFVVFGVIELTAFGLMLSPLILGHYLGIGQGAIERMIVYPGVIWALGFGGAMIGSK
jgi:hypothetical membrane protein